MLIITTLHSVPSTYEHFMNFSLIIDAGVCGCYYASSHSNAVIHLDKLKQ